MKRFCHFLSTGLSKRGRGYQSLGIEDPELGEKVTVPSIAFAKKLIWVGFVLLALLALFLAAAVKSRHPFGLGESHSGCHNPSRRREWRTLSVTEKEDYISSVQCLQSKESLLKPGSSLYDDFAYAHVLEGTVVHYAAGFLPWHRYFIHVFEKTLKEECQYQGSLPYWDWGLDANQLAASPVFSSTTGFGGDGKHGTPRIGAFGGRCVSDGPFTNTSRYWVSKNKGHGLGFEVLWLPHCFSRNFESSSRMAELQERVQPAKIEEVLSMPTYADFVDALERQSHNSIPQFVGGDFYGLTAPNDPVFYLHHAQIDRLWWLWQQQDPIHRMYAYEGPATNVRVHSNGSQQSINSSMQDIISLGHLAEPKEVSNLMTTQSNQLCYSY